MLDCLEQLLGPNILLKSTGVFYKYGRSDSIVGWHQDGIAERIIDAHVPAIWLGLTAATVENGCLRVVPRSHRLGLIPHANRPDANNLTTQGLTAQTEIDAPHDIVMRPGEMSLHHPLVLHGSNANRSGDSRIGFSATYAASAHPGSLTAVAWVRGDGPRHCFEVIDKPPAASLEEAVTAYRARDSATARGKPPSREEQMSLLRNSLKVIERSHWFTELDAYLAAELERFREDTARQLAQFAKSEQ